MSFDPLILQAFKTDFESVKGRFYLEAEPAVTLSSASPSPALVDSDSSPTSLGSWYNETDKKKTSAGDPTAHSLVLPFCSLFTLVLLFF
jgi:hypothetical protein